MARNLDPSWAITSRKRPLPSSTPLPRKRPRGEDNKLPPSSVRQQTLTQAQWITSTPSSAIDESMMTPVEVKPRRPAQRKVTNRNSTLTQMDFLKTRIDLEEDAGIDMSPMSHYDHTQTYAHIPQLDGIYETPRKPRKRKLSPTPRTESSTKKVHESQGTRDYRPTSRRSNHGGFENDQQLRRTSARIAQRPTPHPDPVMTLEYFESALSQPSLITIKGPQKLEIQDSNATEEDVENSTTVSQQRGPDIKNPTTPQKRPSVILSSQTPLSLSPVTRRTIFNTDVELKSPLRERSVNLPTTIPPLQFEDCQALRTTIMEDQRPTSSGLTSRRASKRKARIEDSQANIYSLPESSSPRKRASQQVNSHGIANDEIAVDGVDAAADVSPLLEIPPTSQIIELAPDPSATALGTILSPETDRSSDNQNPNLNEKLTDSGVSEEKNSSSVIIFGNVARESAPDGPDQNGPKDEQRHRSDESSKGINREIQDSDSEFGSPIKNNTQYNFELEHRTSSPLVKSPKHYGSTPRLVAHSGQKTQSIRSEPDSSVDDFLLPELPKADTSITQVSTTRIPLNDVQSSSSPILPVTASITRRSIHPASLPHPSQVSTQEPTQAYLGLSSMAAPSPNTETSRAAENITIKDSSSMRIPLDELPPYQGSPSQRGVDEDSNEDDEYDLDPPSSDPPADLEEDVDVPANPDSPAIPAAEPAEMPPPSHPFSLAPPPPLPQQPDAPSSTNNQTTLSPLSMASGNSPHSSPSPSPSPTQSPPPHSSQQLTPLPGFNNDTQSDFTQNGHVSAAYVRRARERGELPSWYVPRPWRVPGYTRR